MNKREFIKSSTFTALGSTGLFRLLDNLNKTVSNISDKELARQGDFWAEIRKAYRLKDDYINLENGYYCFIPEDTLEAYIKHIREVNYQGSYYMRTVQNDNKKRIAKMLEDLLIAEGDTIAISRNTTESLDIIIGGYPWQQGDEAVYAVQDYGAMKNMFRQVEKRHGIVIKEVSIPINPKSDEELVELYEKAITPKTKLLMICHIINITGHILPVRKICDMAHKHGVEVMVDGAHAVGHFVFNMTDLDCDYYGSSLHKWLSVPLGSGLLYVKKDKISKIWPTFAHWGKEDNDIARLNHTGTHPVATDLAIENAIEFYHKIGPDRKEYRLRYLQNYWVDKARKIRWVKINTPKDRHRSCGIANVGISRMDPKEMANRLFKEHDIWTVGIDSFNVQGCRITPNVFTTTDELDTLVDALSVLAKG